MPTVDRDAKTNWMRLVPGFTTQPWQVPYTLTISSSRPSAVARHTRASPNRRHEPAPLCLRIRSKLGR
jgi:hypothetical protein